MICSVQWLEGGQPSQIEKSVRELGNLESSVTTAIAHPSNDLLLIGLASGMVVAWDPAKAEQLGGIQAHSEDVTQILLLPDQQHFLTCSTDGTVKLWDGQFQLQRTFEVGPPLYSIAISPKGSRLATAGEDTTVRFWDLESGQEVHQLPELPEPISAMYWPKEDEIVLGDTAGILWVWEIEIKRRVRRVRIHRERISRILPAHHSNWYVTTSWDAMIKVWNYQHKERFELPPGSQAVTDAVMTQDDGRLVAAYWDGTVRIWNLENGQQIDEYPVGGDCLPSCALLPGDEIIATVEQQGRLRAWNLKEMGIVRFINQHGGEVYSLCYTPDNVHLLSVGLDGHLKVWDRNERSESGYIEIHDDAVLSCAVSPDNSIWAVGTNDGTVKFWNVDEQTFENSLKAHIDGVSCLSFLPTGDKLVTGSWDMKLKLWNLENQFCELNFDGHSKPVSGCDLTLDGRKCVSSSWDGAAKVWDLIEKRGDSAVMKNSLEAHSDRVFSCAITPDGTRIATGGSDKHILVWQTDAPVEPQVLSGHKGPVMAIKFTPDGHIMISADREGWLMIWDALTFTPFGEIEHGAPILALAISPDGTQGAIGDEMGHVHFFELEYRVGPPWVAVTTFSKPASVWKRGAPPIEGYEVSCLFCGHVGEAQKKQLGDVWQCPKCNQLLRLCPQPLHTA